MTDAELDTIITRSEMEVCPPCGMGETLGVWADRVARERIRWAMREAIEMAGCEMCAKPGAPPHKASKACESGGHAHCSCPRCFG